MNEKEEVKLLRYALQTFIFKKLTKDFTIKMICFRKIEYNT